MRTEGTFSVAARRAAGVTEWVRVQAAEVAAPGVKCTVAVDATMPLPWGFESSRPGVILSTAAGGGGGNRAEVLGLQASDSIWLWSKAKAKPTRPMLAAPVAAGLDAINQWGKH